MRDPGAPACVSCTGCGLKATLRTGVGKSARWPLGDPYEFLTAKHPMPYGLLTDISGILCVKLTRGTTMLDLVYLGIPCALFGLMGLYAAACDRI